MQKARSAAQALRHVMCAAVAVLMICLVLAVPAAAAVVSTNDECIHSNSSWQSLATEPLDILSGQVYIYLVDDIELNNTWNISGPNTDVNLCLNGYNLTFSGDYGSVISVTDNASFTLYDCSGVAKITGGYSARGGGIYVGSGSSFEMYGGIISDCIATDCGGGVFVGLDSTFSMFGGTVYHCLSPVSGGGVENRGVFELSGGKIIDCSAEWGLEDNYNSATSYGGGIYNYGYFRFVDGAITNCSAIEGGGICNAATATVQISGGAISGCTALSMSGGGILNYGKCTITNGFISDCFAYYMGGAVSNSDYDAELTYNSGLIINCSSNSQGGGIYNTGSVIINGGDIKQCIAGDSGGGIYNTGLLTMSGGSIDNCSSPRILGMGLFNNNQLYIYGDAVISGLAHLDLDFLESGIRVGGEFSGNVSDIILIQYNESLSSYEPVFVNNTIIVTGGAPYYSAFTLDTSYYDGLFIAPVDNDLVLSSLPYIPPVVDTEEVLVYFPAGGDGSENNPYLIRTESDLKNLSLYLGESNHYNSHYKVVSDIELLTPSIPIGNETLRFQGVFDGSGHRISGLSIELANSSNLGLFGSTMDSVIKNVVLVNPQIVGYNHVGGLVGESWFGCVIDNCSVLNGNITSSGEESVGGILGRYHDGLDGIIQNCTVICNVSGNSRIGGIVGYGYGVSIDTCTVFGNITGIDSVGGVSGEDGDIEYCFVNGSVSGISHIGGVIGSSYDSIFASTFNGNVYGESYVGGISGWSDGSLIYKSNVSGVINVVNNNGGGISGIFNNGGLIRECFVSVNLTGGDSSYRIGGIVGSNQNTSISNCYLSDTSSITGSDVIGGISGYNNYGIIENCSTNCLIIGYSGRVGGITGGNSGYIWNCSTSSDISGGQKVGGISGSNHGTITHCSMESVVSGKNDVGGVVGYLFGDVDNCFVNCSVSGAYDVGGVAGFNYNGNISRCSVICNITGFADDPEIMNHIGGICGYNDGSIDSCLFVGNILNTNKNTGGISGWNSGDVIGCYVVGMIQGQETVSGICSGLSDETGNVSSCISLVNSLNTTDSEKYRIGFISSNFQNNYAWEGMTSNGVLFVGSDIGPNEKNGESVSSSEFWNNQSFFEDTLGWDFENTWKMNAGNDKYQLPVLQFQETPVSGDATYLLNFEPNPTPTPTPTPDYDDCDSLLNLTSGWNFISIPKSLDASNATALALFGSLDTAGNAILGYNAETQSWEQITADTVIKSLTGYWVYSTTSTAVPLTYPDVPTVPAMKQLHPGWNAVGLSADTDTSASTFFAGLNWRVALPWSCENGMYDSAIVNGGGSGNSPDRLLTLGNGCWLYVEEANVLPGLTA